MEQLIVAFVNALIVVSMVVIYPIIVTNLTTNIYMVREVNWLNQKYLHVKALRSWARNVGIKANIMDTAIFIKKVLKEV